MTDSILKTQAFKLKGRLYTLTVLHLMTDDVRLFTEHLNDVTSKAPKLFDNAPVVIDCSQIQNQNLELFAICACLKRHHMYPLAVQGALPEVQSLAHELGLAVLHGQGASSEKPEKTLEKSSSTKKNSLTGKIHTTPVRSGQQIVSKGGDLIITSSVSHGAELLADGHIHVYGALRGRALAGMSGNPHARIFCQSLEAELLSIAGFYRLSDSIPTNLGPCQIYLQDEHIAIEPF